MRNRSWALALLALAVGSIAACNEKLDGGAACPALCPEQNRVEVRDTILEGIVTTDSSIVGYPAEGRELFMLVASRGDTLDTRGVIRFDTLVTKVSLGGVDSAVIDLDSLTLVLRIDRDRSKTATGSTIEAYDVDTQSDTVHADILARFTPANLIGSVAIPDSVVPDSIIIPLSEAAVQAKITGGLRLRIGLRIRSPRAAEIRFYGGEAGSPARLTYDPVPADTAFKMLSIAPHSNFPANTDAIRADLTDYTIVAKGTPPPPEGTFAVGGAPARRTYLGFTIPSRLVDSTNVLRATLLVTQKPNPLFSALDTVIVFPQVIAAAASITDLTKAVNIILGPGVSIDSLLVTARDSGLREIDMVQVFKQWQAQSQTTVPSHRALAIRAQQEGSSPVQALFFSGRGPAEVRPRIRITYVARLEFGVP